MVEVTLAHPFGIAEIYVGRVAGTRIELTENVLIRTRLARDVERSTRLYGLVEDDSGGPDLAYAMDMEAGGKGARAAPVGAPATRRVTAAERGLRLGWRRGRRRRELPAGVAGGVRGPAAQRELGQEQRQHEADQQDRYGVLEHRGQGPGERVDVVHADLAGQ